MGVQLLEVRATIRSVLLCWILSFVLTLAEGSSFGIEGQAEIEDGYIHVVFDLKDALGDSRIMHKRGIDFGLGRGYSGSQAARSMMGRYQANYAGGPGRK